MSIRMQLIAYIIIIALIFEGIEFAVMIMYV